MKVRPANEKDLPRLVELHRNGGVRYPLPDLLSPEFAAVQVLVDENDRVVMCAAARKTVELYFLMDKSWRSPKWRWQFFIVLHDAVKKVLKGLGLRDCHAWLPEFLCPTFGRRRLASLGWEESDNRSFFKRF